MKREKWNQKTDLRQDPAESVPGVYEEKSEYTLEEILSEFSGDWDSGTVDQTVWDGEALSMSEFDPYLFDTYEQPAVKPAAKKKPARPSAPAVQIDEEESQIAAESVAPEALQTPEVTADPAEAASENNKSDSLSKVESAARVKPEKARCFGCLRIRNREKPHPRQRKRKSPRPAESRIGRRRSRPNRNPGKSVRTSRRRNRFLRRTLRTSGIS